LTIGVPSKLNVIHKGTPLGRVSPTLDSIYEENTIRQKWDWTLLCSGTRTPEPVKKVSFPMSFVYYETIE
jgi:hypothetical protein